MPRPTLQAAPVARTPASFLPARVRRGRAAKARHVVRVTLLTTVYRRMLVFAYELRDRVIPVRNAPAGCRFARLRPEEVPNYLEFRLDQREDEIRRRLDVGHTCHVCWRDGEIIEAGWSATQRVHVGYLGRDLLLRPGEVYEYDAFTSPGRRGRGLYMAHNSYVAREHQREGMVRSIALVAIENEGAVKTLARAGLRIDGCIHRLGIGGTALFWQRPFAGRTLPRLISPDRATPAVVHAEPA